MFMQNLQQAQMNMMGVVANLVVQTQPTIQQQQTPSILPASAKPTPPPSSPLLPPSQE